MKEKKMLNNVYKSLVKPILDRLLALIFVLLFWWLYLVIAILVRIKLGKPILFKQERPGKINPKTGKEIIFKLYKFRTMTDEKDENGELLSDEIRLTKFGKFLRSTSLDELPEILFNILIFHNMSWVGPRPLLVKYIERYTEEQRHRHDVLPGLTGYAQVNGRNSISWEERFDLDVWYTKNLSLKLDLQIIINTIKVVLCRKGISSDTCVTMEEFIGEKVDVK